MEELIVRPSIKLLKTAYAIAILALVGVGVATALSLLTPLGAFVWLSFVPPLAYLCWIMSRHIQLRLTKLVVNDDRVRYEAGLLSKRMHAIDVSKVHDVRVEQSVKQRLLGLGDLSVETANNSSSIHIKDIDDPQKVADRILQLSRKALQQRANHAAQQ